MPSNVKLLLTPYYTRHNMYMSQLKQVFPTWRVVLNSVNTESAKHVGVTGIFQLQKSGTCQLRTESFVSSLGQLLWVCVCVSVYMCVCSWGSGGDEALSAGRIRPSGELQQEEPFQYISSKNLNTHNQSSCAVSHSVRANQCSHWV